MSGPANLFADIPADLPEELFTDLLDGRRFRLERIVSRGHATPEGEWYDQENDEWVVLLRGAAELVFGDDSAPVRLEPGDADPRPSPPPGGLDRPDAGHGLAGPSLCVIPWCNSHPLRRNQA